MSGTRNTPDSNATPPARVATTVEAATDSIAAILARESDTPEPQPTPKVEEGETEEVAPEQSEQPEDETQAEPEGEAGAEGEEDAQDEGEEPEEAEPQQREITVEIDGKTTKLTADEVAKGYLRMQDYTRKTQALSEERRAALAEIAAVRTERQQYAALLPAIAQQLQQAVGQEPDWDRLAAEDPVEFNRQWAAKQLRDQKMAAIQAEQQRLAAEAAREQQQQRAEMLKAARDQLGDLNPAWKNPERWKQDRNAIREYLAGMGYSDEQVAALDDPRAVMIAHKARLYDEAMKKGAIPARPQQQQARPAPAAAARPGPAPTQRRPITDHTRAKMRLAKTHDVRDAAKVIEGLL